MRAGEARRDRARAPFAFLPQRLASLDGLRGLAALLVLVHHEAMTVPTLAASYYESATQPARGSIAWWLSFTPLHLAWAGTEAVFLFFVLSGVVLVLPVLRSRGFDWIGYYPRRLVRIYGPVVCVVLAAFVAQLLLPRFNDHRLGRWVNLRPNETSVHDLLRNLTLMQGTSGLVSPLWSLRWEVVFSALLPLFVGVAVVGRRFPRTAAALTLAAVVVGALFDANDLFFLPMFGAGALIIGCWDRIAVRARALSRRRWPWPVLLMVAALLCSATWWLQGLGAPMHDAQSLEWLGLPGVVLLLVAAVHWRPLARLLEIRLVQWLGRISFSLYLVHEPIVTGARLLLFQQQLPTWASIAVSAPVALLSAHLFARFVEAPFHALSRRAGRAVTAAAGDVLPQPLRSVAAPASVSERPVRERVPA